MAAHKRPLILPPMYFAAVGVAMVLAKKFLTLFTLLEPPVSYLGALVLVGGLAIVIAGVVLFRKASTGLVPFDKATTVVTSGIFGHTRNPMYLGMTVSLTGVAIITGDLSAFLLLPVFPLIMHYRFILPEEQFMEQSLGRPYLEYRKRVRRWL
ncbi:MAG: isoprenylcysteine carboxylmethyltransferase family protein [Gammaproteobacteria bacterium]|nr:isoprenylcysteine carboxylmethyltransferase family protein [Gammaproteobacteria bacterium]NNM21447.1 isoprenylcysteine carboxylmethyltransferase family protein [Gammaproteobacteria bacterium]